MDMFPQQSREKSCKESEGSNLVKSFYQAYTTLAEDRYDQLLDQIYHRQPQPNFPSKLRFVCTDSLPESPVCFDCNTLVRRKLLFNRTTSTHSHEHCKCHKSCGGGENPPFSPISESVSDSKFFKNLETNNLQEENEQLRTDLTDSQSEREGLKKHLVKLQDELTALQQHNNLLHLEASSVQHEKSVLVGEVERLTKENWDLVTYAAFGDQLALNLKEELFNCKQENNELASSLKGINQTEKNLKDKMKAKFQHLIQELTSYASWEGLQSDQRNIVLHDQKSNLEAFHGQPHDTISETMQCLKQKLRDAREALETLDDERYKLNELVSEMKRNLFVSQHRKLVSIQERHSEEAAVHSRPVFAALQGGRAVKLQEHCNNVQLQIHQELLQVEHEGYEEEASDLDSKGIIVKKLDGQIHSQKESINSPRIGFFLKRGSEAVDLQKQPENNFIELQIFQSDVCDLQVFLWNSRHQDKTLKVRMRELKQGSAWEMEKLRKIQKDRGITIKRRATDTQITKELSLIPRNRKTVRKGERKEQLEEGSVDGIQGLELLLFVKCIQIDQTLAFKSVAKRTLQILCRQNEGDEGNIFLQVEAQTPNTAATDSTLFQNERCKQNPFAQTASTSSGLILMQPRSVVELADNILKLGLCKDVVQSQAVSGEEVEQNLPMTEDAEQEWKYPLPEQAAFLMEEMIKQPKSALFKAHNEYPEAGKREAELKFIRELLQEKMICIEQYDVAPSYMQSSMEFVKALEDGLKSLKLNIGMKADSLVDQFSARAFQTNHHSSENEVSLNAEALTLLEII